MNSGEHRREAIGQRKEHLLHALYYLQVEQGEEEVAVEHPEIDRHDGGTLEELEAEGLVKVVEGRVHLTEAGERLGRDVVRRHRLAERLMSDVLGMPPDTGDYIAGEMEHIVSPELTSSICTLLGHPSECPHGNPIPPGPCCLEGARAVEAAVVPLCLMRAGEKGTIAYLTGGHAPGPAHGRRMGGRLGGIGRGPGRWEKPPSGGMRGRRRVAQLTSLGLFPGEEIEVVQTSPAFVVRVGGTTLALDAGMAGCIRVRRVTDKGQENSR
jgi:DtxR family Mn-dependent transcriptional regulator